LNRGRVELKAISEVFWRFLWLGCISFGGPAAHIGYFRKTFVERLGWLDEQAYGRLIALSQFLPGPGSSQIGFALGLQRAGLAGGVAAFLGFTLPSFLLLYGLAVGSSLMGAQLHGVISGLKLLAVVVVADACLTMFAGFCRTALARSLALLTCVVLWLSPGLLVQLALLVVGALLGGRFLMPQVNEEVKRSNDDGVVYWPLLVLLCLSLAAVYFSAPLWVLFEAFFHSGLLVFGGGHVVLPLLQQTLGASLEPESFLLGYAAAQGVPGPMFSLSAFLGAQWGLLNDVSPLLGALVATLAIFLPGFLLVVALLGAWESLAAKPRIAGAVAGINACVVGLLLAALYQPVFTSAVSSPVHMSAVAVGLFLLRGLRLPIVGLVVAFSAFGWWLGY